MNQKIPALDGLRGVMALWVFITHVIPMATLPLQKNEGWGWLLANGEFAVGVFIVLSGFVITLNLQASKSISISSFFIRRGFRLFPVYLFCLLISALILNLSLDVLHSLPWDGLRTQDRIIYLQNTKNNYVEHLLLHIFLLHGLIPEKFLPSTSYAFMGQAWSLTLEWQFYLLVPFVYLFLSRFMNWRALSIFVSPPPPAEWGISKFSIYRFGPAMTKFLLTAMALLVLIHLSRRWNQVSFLPAYLWLFGIGFGCAKLYVLHSAKKISIPQFFAYLLLFLVIAALKGIIVVSVVIFMVVFLAAINNKNNKAAQLIAGLFSGRVALALGRISYGFYCIHMAAIFLTAYVLLEWFAIDNRTLYCILLMPISLALALGLARLLNHFVEEPGIAFGKRLSSDRLLTTQPLLGRL